MALTAVRTGASSWNLEDNGVIVDKFFLAATDTADKTVADLQAIQAAVAAQVNTAPTIVDGTEIFADAYGRRYTKQSLAKLVLEGSALVASPPVYTDHFCFGSTETGEVGELGWSFTGGTAAYIAPQDGRPGILSRTSAATSGSVTSLYPLSAANIGLLLKSNLQEVSWSFHQPGNTNVATYRIGVASDAAGNPPSDGLYLESLPTNTNWFTVRRRAGSETRQDTGIPVSNAWTDLRIRRVGADNWEFYVNGGAFQVIYTIGNIPLETTALLPFSQVIPNSANARTLNHDFFSLVTK